VLSVISEGLRLPVVISLPSVTKRSGVFIDLDMGGLFLFPVCSALKTRSRAHRCEPADSTSGEIFLANNKGQPERELSRCLSAEVVLLLSHAGQGFSKGASDACSESERR